MAQVCRAIQSQRVVRFSYDGGSRTVEPFCHGTSTAGNEVLRGYQTGGYSSSGEPVGWKLFEMAKLSSLTITDTQFSGRRPGYNPNDSAMQTIHCHV